MAKKSTREIIAEEMPGVEIIETRKVGSSVKSADSSASRSTRSGSSISDLRKRFLGADADAADADEEDLESADATEDDDEVEVSKVRSKKRSDDPLDDPGSRVVITSTKTGRATGAQG